MNNQDFKKRFLAKAESIAQNNILWRYVGLASAVIIATIILLSCKYDIRWGIMGVVFTLALINYALSFSEKHVLRELSAFVTMLFAICFAIALVLSSVFYIVFIF